MGGKLKAFFFFFLAEHGPNRTHVKVHTAAKFHVVHATLKSIEEKLPAAKFLRVHRSYIVAINKIDFIQEGTIAIGKTTIPVADTHKAALNKRLNLL